MVQKLSRSSSAAVSDFRYDVCDEPICLATNLPGLVPGPLSPACSQVGAVQRQQLAQDLVVGDVRRPTVRGSHSRVKGVVRIGEPLRAGVVEVRQRALLERLGRVLVARNRPLRIAGDRLVDPLALAAGVKSLAELAESLVVVRPEP